jgi:hypothetical protein
MNQETLKNMSSEEKLKALRELHAHSSPEAIVQINQWENELLKLKFESDWLEHPNAIKLRDVLTSQLDRINDVLSNNENLSADDRKAYFKNKDLILILMATLSSNKEQIASIDRSLSAEL